MKSALILGATCFVGLTGCSTNTRNENTAIGAVTGTVVGGVAGGLIGSGAGAVALGAVAGALVGGVIGHSMESSDSTQMYTSMEKNSSNQPTTWTNESTKVTYVIVPTSKVMHYKGYSYCRKYRATATMSNGEHYHFHGIACRQADGTWMAATRH